MKIQKKSSKLPVLLASATVVLLAGLGGYFFFLAQSSSTISEDGINYAPSTPDDASLNESIKNEIVSKDDNEPTSRDIETETDPTTKNEVTPVISAWGQPKGPGTDLKLNGYVPQIIEKDGTCTLTMQKDGKTTTASKGSLVNAQNTSCGQLTVLSSQLEPGDWQVTLSYESSTSSGTSKTITIEIE